MWGPFSIVVLTAFISIHAQKKIKFSCCEKECKLASRALLVRETGLSHGCFLRLFLDLQYCTTFLYWAKGHSSTGGAPIGWRKVVVIGWRRVVPSIESMQLGPTHDNDMRNQRHGSSVMYLGYPSILWLDRYRECSWTPHKMYRNRVTVPAFFALFPPWACGWIDSTQWDIIFVAPHLTASTVLRLLARK